MGDWRLEIGDRRVVSQSPISNPFLMLLMQRRRRIRITFLVALAAGGHPTQAQEDKDDDEQGQDTDGDTTVAGCVYKPVQKLKNGFIHRKIHRATSQSSPKPAWALAGVRVDSGSGTTTFTCALSNTRPSTTSQMETGGKSLKKIIPLLVFA